MTTTQQPEALRLAGEIQKQADYDVTIGMPLENYRFYIQVSNELRRLHSRVAILETQLIGMDSRRAEEKLRADQMTKQHDTQAALNRDARSAISGLQKRKDDWKWRALEAESQLEAIGAGGVESLRKKEST